MIYFNIDGEKCQKIRYCLKIVNGTFPSPIQEYKLGLKIDLRIKEIKESSKNILKKILENNNKHFDNVNAKQVINTNFVYLVQSVKLRLVNPQIQNLKTDNKIKIIIIMKE